MKLCLYDENISALFYSLPENQNSLPTAWHKSIASTRGQNAIRISYNLAPSVEKSTRSAKVSKEQSSSTFKVDNYQNLYGSLANLAAIDV